MADIHVHEPEAVWKGAQIGIELNSSVYGTTVPATIRLGETNLSFSRKINHTPQETKGFLLPTNLIPGREWGIATFDGIPTFATDPANASGTKLGGDIDNFIYSVVSDDQVSPHSLQMVKTLEYGGEEMGGAIVDSWRVGGDVDKCSYGGTMTGKIPTTATETPNLDPIAQTPFVPANLDINIAGAGKLLRVFAWELSVSNIWGTAVYAGSTGPKNILQKAASAEFSVKVAADTQGLVPLTYLKSGIKTVVVKLESGVSPAKFTLSFTFDAVFGEPDPFTDEDGVFAIGYKSTIVNKTGTAIAVVRSVS